MSVLSFAAKHPIITAGVATAAGIGAFKLASGSDGAIGPIHSRQDNENQLGITALIGAIGFAGFLTTAMVMKNPQLGKLHPVTEAFVGATVAAGGFGAYEQFTKK